MDPVLQPYLRATTAVEEQRRISQLLSDFVAPLAKYIINQTLAQQYEQAGRQFGTKEFDQAASLVTLRILARLRERKTLGAQDSIPSFHRFVTSTTHDVSSDFFRREFPGRYTIAIKLRYLISHRADWAIWEHETGGLRCGLASWKDGAKIEAAGAADPVAPAEDPERLTAKTLEHFVAETFAQSDGPMHLTDLVRLATARWKANEEPRGAELEPVAFAADSNRYLTRLWREVMELPVRQRLALLLHMRDEHGRSILDLFIAAGVVNFEGIGGAFDFSWSRTLETWNSLPLEDPAIARLLCTSRVEAAGLRRVARERISLAMRRR